MDGRIMDNKKSFFNKNNEEYKCPAGCKKIEKRLHYIECTAGDLQKGHIKRRTEFSKEHDRLRTSK